MNKIKSAVFAGICMAAASFNAHAAAYLADSLSLGESKTYTLTFGPEVTNVSALIPYIQVDGHGDFGRYIDFPQPDGTVTREFDIDYIVPVTLICTSIPCTKGDTAGNGYVTLKLLALNNQLILSLDNQYAGYDNCTEHYSSHCAVRVHSPMYLNAGFRLDGEPVDFTYATTQNAVPEPATWAMMIAGFGLVGATLRRKATVAA